MEKDQQDSLKGRSTNSRHTIRNLSHEQNLVHVRLLRVGKGTSRQGDQIGQETSSTGALRCGQAWRLTAMLVRKHVRPLVKIGAWMICEDSETEGDQ